MDTSTVLSEVTHTISVVIGGVLAIAGGIAGHFITHRLSSKREFQQLRREKLELLLTTLYEHRDWVAKEKDRLVFGEAVPESPSPLDKAQALQILYFPELAKAFLPLIEATSAATNYCYKEASKRLADQAAWLSAYDREAFPALYQAHGAAFTQLVTAISRLAKAKQ